METDWASLPVGADPSRDMPVGQNEFGGMVYQTMNGQQYTIMPQAAQQPRGGSTWDRVKELPRNALAGAANALVSGFTAPGRALAGEAVTNGDVWNTAGMAQFGAAPMKAPAGALRSGALGSQSVSDQILGLLKSGKGKSVTDEMMAAADPEYLYRNYDLPMDAASRAARRDQWIKGNPLTVGQGGPSASSLPGTQPSSFRSTPKGDTSTFHATDYDVNAFDNAALGKETAQNAADFEPGSWAHNLAMLGHWTNGKPLAEDLGRSVDMPLYLRGNRTKAKSLDALDAKINRAGGIDNFRTGSDGVTVMDEELGGASQVTYDPRNIRSRFARFDPRLSHLANLSAAGAGVAYVNELSGQGDDALLAYLQSRGM